MGRLAHIASAPRFRELSGEHQKGIATVVVAQVFRAGNSSFRRGDRGIGSYVVISGRVKIFKRFPALAEASDDSRVFFFRARAVTESYGMPGF